MVELLKLWVQILALIINFHTGRERMKMTLKMTMTKKKMMMRVRKMMASEKMHHGGVVILFQWL